MTKDTKILAGVLVFSLFLIVGFAVWQGGKESPAKEVTATTSSVDIKDLEVTPASYNIGTIKMKDGNVVKTYEVKNTSAETMKLQRIATSCMCTKTKIKIGDKETREFGMEGMGDKNPPINLELPSGQTATVTAIFDPAAHGPKGVGSFDRTVFLYFSNPSGTKELKFNGTVVN
ncbi:hypothetical protein A2801_03835 [Candidatus Woesebacteria bacterium RIFCSPHIGHO2_01_FULL_41_10]|uniref:DUF1573 domain-containing protein n=1 Tax=Candidatus Woesebacteria bacterium RIFCSPHIGHO2_01_FULL_41_10 TaxID=1802500 RepID=A0A1F7YUE0_9BACT|nr:MAG: hypothetical protein A2801_03835 [Candidatus Woesebacteria bacterium RIFCSPHIGHO2_01_FULL_41_10]